MFLSHADGVPDDVRMVFLHADDPRTPKPSTIVINICAFEYLYGAVTTVFFFYDMALGRLHIVSESLSVYIQVIQYCAETLRITYSASINCGRFLGDIWFLHELNLWDYPNSAHRHCEGTPCVVPSVDVKTVLFTYRFEGCLYELVSA